MPFNLDTHLDANIENSVQVREKHDYSRVINLSSNELLHPALAEHVGAFGRSLSLLSLNHYPYWHHITREYASFRDTRPENLIFTAGSDEAIKLLFSSIFQQTGKVVIAYPNYESYFVYADCFGVRTVMIPFPPVPDRFIETLRQSIADHSPCSVIITNPHGFNGHSVRLDELQDILQECLNAGSLVIVDEAYGAFGEYTSVPFIAEFPNLVVIESFSKAFGMAGFRLGSVFANSRVIEYLKRFRAVNSVSTVAIEYLRFSLQHLDVIRDVQAEIISTRQEWLTSIPKICPDLSVIPGGGNFVLAAARSLESKQMYVSGLMNKDIWVKDLGEVEHYECFFRMTVPHRALAADVFEVLRTLSDPVESKMTDYADNC